MLYNQADGELIILERNNLKQEDSFKQLGAWIQSSEKHMETRIGQAWVTLNKIERV